MSFMYNPFPFDDPKPINRPKLSEKTINSVVTGGTPNVAKKFVAQIADKVKSEGVIVGIDGYTTANWNLFVNLLARECVINGFEFEAVDSTKAVLKSGKEIDEMKTRSLSGTLKSTLPSFSEKFITAATSVSSMRRR